MFHWVEAQDGGAGDKANSMQDLHKIHLIAPPIFGGWAFLQIAILEVCQIITFDEGILCFFAIRQRFVVFVFLGMSDCLV